MADKILIIATEADNDLYRVVKAFCRNYRLYFLTTPRSSFCGLTEKTKLANLGVNYLDNSNPSGSIKKLLANNKISYAFIFIKDSLTIRTITRDVRLVSPDTKVIIFTGELSFFSKPVKNNAEIGVFIENRLTAYAQVDFIVTRKNKDKIFLLGKVGGFRKNIFSMIEILGKRPEDCGVIFKKNEVEKKELTSIIIPCFNQVSCTRSCIESVIKYTTPSYEIIAVDNGSTDGTKEYLNSLKSVKIISNNKNLGFTTASNQGMKAAVGDYIVLLNNDVIVTPGWLNKMIECSLSSRSIGLVGPCTNNIYGVQQIKGAGYKNIKNLPGWAYIYQKRNSGKWFEVFWLAGFCLLIKREVIKKIGLLDEKYIMGTFQDHDFCLAARNAGYKLFCCADVFVHHFGTMSYSNETIIRLDNRNKKIFVKKWGMGSYDLLMESLMYGAVLAPSEISV